MNPLQQRRHDIADRLKDVGLKVTLDPANTAGRCVLVGPPVVEKVRNVGRCVNAEAVYPVILMASPPGDDAAVESLLADVAVALVAMASYRPTEAEPQTYVIGKKEIPAYVFAISQIVPLTEGA